MVGDLLFMGIAAAGISFTSNHRKVKNILNYGRDLIIRYEPIVRGEENGNIFGRGI